uniref:Uncharacterized protein n=1 Tax=Arundo donax TaxID=35708 RepID=A0A0A9HVD0_ARUDO
MLELIPPAEEYRPGWIHPPHVIGIMSNSLWARIGARTPRSMLFPSDNHVLPSRVSRGRKASTGIRIRGLGVG